MIEAVLYLGFYLVVTIFVVVLGFVLLTLLNAFIEFVIELVRNEE